VFKNPKSAILRAVATGLQISIRGEGPRRSWREVLRAFLDDPDVAAASAFFGGVFGDDGVGTDSPFANGCGSFGRQKTPRIREELLGKEGTNKASMGCRSS
jgi:hypothetical protein